MLELLVIGAGKWATECWAPLLQEHKQSIRVRAVVDRDRDRAAAFATRFRDANAYPTIDAALDSGPGFAAAVVLTNPWSHASAIGTLAGAAVPVLTEKPLATTLTDARHIAAVVRRAGVKCAVVQNYRYQEPIQFARDLIAGGSLGDVLYASARFAADYRVRGSWDVGEAHTMKHPLLIEASVHHFDVIRFLSGHDVRRVSAVAMRSGESFDGAPVAGCLLWLTNGGFATYEGNLVAGGNERRWRNEHYRVDCERGSVTVTGPAVRIDRGQDHEEHAFAAPDMLDGHRVLLKRFVTWLSGGPPLDTTLDDNLRTMAILAAAVGSADQDGDVVPVVDI